MKRPLVVAGAVAGAAVVVVAVALALGGGSDGDGGDTAGEAPPEESASGPPETEPPVSDDPLCVAQREREASQEALGTIDGPADFEAFVTAQLTFHTTATGVLDEPDASAFRDMAAYWQQVTDFYAPRGWDQQVDIADAASVPRLTTGDATAPILSARCGVAAPSDVSPTVPP